MIYVGLFLFSFLLTYLIKNYAIKNALLAEVNERSSHSVPTPHGGGIAIAMTWFVGIIYFYSLGEIDKHLFFALLVGMIISIVSYLDDLFELSPKIRLLTQAFVAILGLYFLGGMKELDFFILSIENQFLTNIFAFFMIIWFINLYNFLDGIDGYAGAEAIFLGVSGYLFFGDSYLLVLVMAVLGFLVWNWHKAKIFMGDVGSTLLGYNIAIFTIYYTNQDAQNFWVWIALFGLFWFDATLTLIRRKKNGEKLSQAHKKHAYQRIVQAGWSHSKVVKMAILINILLFCTVWIFPPFLSLLITITILFFSVKKVDQLKGFS